jgi:hypothetical protein
MVLGEFQKGCGDIGSDLDVLGKNVLGVVAEAVDLSELVARTDTDRVSNVDGVHGDKSFAQDFNSVLTREATLAIVIAVPNFAPVATKVPGRIAGKTTDLETNPIKFLFDSCKHTGIYQKGGSCISKIC